MFVECILHQFKQASIVFGSSQSFLWRPYVLLSFTSMAGVLFTKLLAHFTPTVGAFLAPQIVSAISLIRDRVGDSPWASSCSIPNKHPILYNSHSSVGWRELLSCNSSVESSNKCGFGDIVDLCGCQDAGELTRIES
jgi:hypothetical protein